MIFLFVALLQFQPAHAGWFKNFCERHLIAEHPYQKWVNTLTTKELTMEFRREAGKRRWRRQDPYQFGHDEYEMVLSVLLDRYQISTPAEQETIVETFEDYPEVRFTALRSRVDSPGD